MFKQRFFFTHLCHLTCSLWTWVSCEIISRRLSQRLFYLIKVICLRPYSKAHSNINISQFLLTGYRQVLRIGTLRCSTCAHTQVLLITNNASCLSNIWATCYYIFWSSDVDFRPKFIWMESTVLKVSWYSCCRFPAILLTKLQTSKHMRSKSVQHWVPLNLPGGSTLQWGGGRWILCLV